MRSTVAEAAAVRGDVATEVGKVVVVAEQIAAVPTRTGVTATSFCMSMPLFSMSDFSCLGHHSSIALRRRAPNSAGE